jgi:hypothetical protein
MAGSASDYLELKVLDHVLKNTAYTSPTTVYAALFTTIPTDSGPGTEVTGGSYARQAITFGSASSGASSNSVAVTFPAATASWGAVVAFAIFDASTTGNMLFWGELLGPRKVFTVVPGTDVFTSASHGLADGTAVEVEVENGTLPSPLADNTVYYIINTATNTFKLSATAGGSAIDITTTGDGTLGVFASYKKTVASGDTAKFAIGQLIVNLD